MATATLRFQRADMPNLTRRNPAWSASNGQKDEWGQREADASLASVVKSLQAGDHSAQRKLYESCHQNVYHLAVRMVGIQDAADVTQQTFLQVFRSIGQFNGQSKFSTWLYRVAVNESLQHLRRKRRWQYRCLDWEPMDESHHGESTEQKELLERALAQIDPELRSIFLLRETEGMSYREIAETLQIPEGTVGSRLNRARRELQRLLSELGLDR